MAARTLAAAQRTEQARQALSVAAVRLDEALDIATRALEGARATSAAQGLALLVRARQTITEEQHRLAQAEGVVLGFHAALALTDGVGGATYTHETQAAAGPRASSEPGAHTRRSQREVTAALGVGAWDGLTAAEHVIDAGRAIGRHPARRKKYAIREVRSVEELDALFDALSSGGERLHDATYAGSSVLLPDGTRIGYRTKSKTTVEPTIDIKLPDQRRLKIHVNTEGWIDDAG
ncbi:hypothetical protein [Actinoalloteichus hymeniacidonis]|uniref:hypothetical protein n=1 Tax=Actinoalloteichus hymeniacidonis TaxID=340345 RepID=UPI0012FA0226|nr:hypothetical protein [Actinoalloteichus hymeniacidonis]MBB5906998.1 hypothetical protein [Actinoalloteichus hymeniacidonis]